MAEALRLRLRSVRHSEGRVSFTVGWNEYRNRTAEWISTCDRGELWTSYRDGQDEIRYRLRTVRVLILVPLLLGIVSFLVMRSSLAGRMALWLGGSVLLIGTNYVLGAVGVRSFVERHIREAGGQA